MDAQGDRRRCARRIIRWSIGLLLLGLGACGTYVPQVQEPWEAQAVGENLEARIKENIFCELIEAIRYVNFYFRNERGKPVPDYYGVQLQTTLTFDEKGEISPSLTYNEPLRLGQMFNLAGAATFSSTATRTHTQYAYYNVGKISAPGANRFCTETQRNREGSSPLLLSELGLRDFLISAGKATSLIPSSRAPKDKKDIKREIFSYEIKFIIVTSGTLNPTWKLVSLSVNTGAPLLSAGRTRTHDLTLTFAPEEERLSSPSAAALQTHFNGQLLQSLDRLAPERRPF